MAAKSFKGGFDSLISGVTKKEKVEELKVETGAKRGRPKTNFREVTKTSQVGTRENETRATFIVNEEQLESLKALAYWERLSIKEVLAKAIGNYLKSKRDELYEASKAYRGWKV